MNLRYFVQAFTAISVVLVSLRFSATAATPLSVIREADNRVAIGWEVTPGELVRLETSTALSSWQPVTSAPVVVGNRASLSVVPSDASQYFRLRAVSPTVTVIAETSPQAGETGVAARRETILRLSTPLAAGTKLTTERFYAEFGGRRLLSRVELSSDRQTATLFYLENLPPSARVAVTFDGNAVNDANGVLIDADANGQPGGIMNFSFTTGGTSGLPGTAVIGRVFAAEKNPNGSNKPLANVTISVDGAEETLRATTDTNGWFTLRPAPAGRFFVHIDGRTARGSQWPRGAYYPVVGKAWEAVAGKTNNLAGGSGEIFLPFIPIDALKTVSATTETRIGFPPSVIATNAAFADVSIVVPANALFADSGVRGGKVGIAPVPPDRLPGPLPPGIEAPIVITVQTDGGQNFDRPVAICFPNVIDPVLGKPLPAGSKQALVSFNHDIGEWEAVGTMTVSADGKLICSDPGSGIRQPGWHIVQAPPATPPPPPLPPPPGSGGGGDPPDDPPNDPPNCQGFGAENLRICAEVVVEVKAECLAQAWTMYTTITTTLNQLYKDGTIPFSEYAERLKLARQSYEETLRECEGFDKFLDQCIDCAIQNQASGRLELSSNKPRLAAGEATTGDRIQAKLDELTALLAQTPLPDSGILPAAVAQILNELGSLGGGNLTQYLLDLTITHQRALAANPQGRRVLRGNAPEEGIPFAAQIYRPGGMFTLRGITRAFGQYEIFVPRDGVLLRVVAYDPKRRMVAQSFPDNRPESPYRLPAFYFKTLKTGVPDSDADGLVDVGEFVLGTNPLAADSDGDGLRDGLEAAEGGNPLDGQPATFGVIAGADTPGQALGVYARGDHAYVADGTGGLAVLELRGIREPLRVAQLAIPGRAHSIAGAENTVALATGNQVALVDVTDPASPRLRMAPDLKSPVNAVAVRSGQVAVALANGDLVILDAVTGEERQRIAGLSAKSLSDLQFEGNLLFVLSLGELISLERVDGLWSPAGRVEVIANPPLLEVGLKLTVHRNVAWVGSAGGILSIDVSSPEGMKTLTRPPPNQLAVHDLVATGAGTLAVATENPGQRPVESALSVSLYDVRKPDQVDLVLGTFQTAGSERAVVLHRGLILVAATEAGLQLVNFLPPDFGTVPPTVTLLPEYPGVLARAGFGGTLPVSISAADDVGIRSVELEVDGIIVGEQGSATYSTTVPLPTQASGKTQVTLRGKATDLAGNFTWTSPLTVPLVGAAAPPQVIAVEPGPKSAIVPNTVSEVRVILSDPTVTTITSETLTLVRATGSQFGGESDLPIPGKVAYDATTRTILLTTDVPMGEGRYQATLAAGIADAFGNARIKPYRWQFETGPGPKAAALFPPRNLVRVGGTLEELRVTFDQPVPRISGDTYVWTIFHRPLLAHPGGVAGPVQMIAPLEVLQSADLRTLTLRTSGPFPPGSYQVRAVGPSVGHLTWDFDFRDVPNEAVAASSQFTGWKYSPVPGSADTVGEELIVNLPGQVAPINMGGVRSLVAQTDIRFVRERINVEVPLQAMAGLEIANTVFGPGVTDVRGPIAFFSVFGGVLTDLGAHTINAYGGGYLRDHQIRLSDRNGALINHPGSTLVLSNGTEIAFSGTSWSNSGAFVNLGTLRSIGGTAVAPIRLDDVRVRNAGSLEVVNGVLRINSLDHEGVIDVSAGANLHFPIRVRGGATSSITGAGTIEFGEFNTNTRRVVSAVDAELMGEVDPRLSLNLVAGSVTLSKPVVQPLRSIALQNGSALRLLASANLGAVALSAGTLSFGADGQIATLTSNSSGNLQVTTLTRLLGDLRSPGLNVLGPGVLALEGSSLFSNQNQTVVMGIGHATLRNAGTFRFAANGTAASSFFRRREADGLSGTGSFENLGRFEQTTDRTLLFAVPFRNAGLASFGRGPVVFDAQNNVATDNAGRYVPLPGAELVLNNTDFQHPVAGALDLAAGVLRGVGRISAVDAVTRPRVINRAVLRPGNPIGDLNIRATDGFEQTSTGEIVVTLASGGSSWLRLDGTTARLAGTLRVELVDGFSPAIGKTYTVMSFVSRSGEFDTLILPDLGVGKKLAVVYTNSRVDVEVVAAP